MHVARRLMLAAGLLAAPLPSLAATPGQWGSDAMGTFMTLSFNHSNLMEVQVTVPSVHGSLSTGTDDAELKQLSFDADLTSLTAYNPRWQRELTSLAFFDVAHTPRLTFQADTITRTDGGYRVAGVLTARGRSHPASFTLVASKILVFHDRAFRGLTLDGAIDRHAFGLPYQERPGLEQDPEYGPNFKLHVVLELSRVQG